jgi:PAS domain S-box-containing protein
MPERSTEQQLADALDALASAQATNEVLIRRVEELEGGPHVERGALARALAGMQQELNRRSVRLEQSEASYRALYESSPSPMLTLDGRGTVVACNRRCLEWLERSADDLLGRPLTNLFGDGDREDLQRLIDADWIWASERRLTLADGRRAQLTVVPLTSGGVERFYLTLHDVTTIGLLDEARGKRRRLEELAGLAGAVARELTDPVSIVQGRLELLLELGVRNEDSVMRHLGLALEHAHRVSDTLRNLRLVGRSASPTLAKVFVAEIVDEALRMIGPRSEHVRVDVTPPDLVAGGDGAMLARVVANMVRRGLDSSPRREPMEVKAVRTRDGVELTVTTRVSHRSRESVGPDPYSIDQTLLQSVGGRIELLPHGEGVRALLPLPPGQRVRAKPVVNQLLAVGQPAFAATLNELLARDGFSITSSPNGETALQHLASDGEVDAVATELILDGMSGLALAEQVMQNHPGLQGRVVVVTESPLSAPPSSVITLASPLRRVDVLGALGRRVRDRL